METVEIVFISAIVFPFLATATVMVFVHRAIQREAKRKAQAADAEKLISSLKDVVESQDNVLEVYRNQ